jgi:hypothetical protein
MINKDWTTVALSKKQICFLDRISKESKFSGGRKLSRTSVLRAILKAGKKLKIDLSEVRCEKELKERILASFQR